MGRQIVALLKSCALKAEIMAVGTNSMATTAMLKAGADNAATGENAVIVACRNADVIIGPVGIAIADSLFGEVTPKMACAVGQSNAERVLIPRSNCGNIIAGTNDLSLTRLIEDGVDCVVNLCK